LCTDWSFDIVIFASHTCSWVTHRDNVANFLLDIGGIAHMPIGTVLWRRGYPLTTIREYLQNAQSEGAGVVVGGGSDPFVTVDQSPEVFNSAS
jgi:hypothetical protein